MHLYVTKIGAFALSSVFLPFFFRDLQFMSIIPMRSEEGPEKHGTNKMVGAVV